MTQAEHGEGCVATNQASTMVVFQSRRPGGHGGWDIWYSTRSGRQWSAPVNAGSGINSSQHELDASLSADGTILVFTRSAHGGATAVAAAGASSDKQTDLYLSRWSNGFWGEAQKIPPPVSLAESAEFRPVLSQDGKRLYFGSNRNGGAGGYDIYVSRFENGTWREPVNLGMPVNSAADEIDVAVAPHERTLILARRPKISEPQRLFISYRKGESWSEPVDMGPRFNTGTGDGCPWLGYDGKTLYVNSSVGRDFPFRLLTGGSIVWVLEYAPGY